MSNLASMFESSLDDVSFTLKAGKYDDKTMAVSGFTGHEKLSSLFVYRIDVVIDAETTPSLDDAIGQDAEFRILREGKPERVVRGMVDNITPYGTAGRQRAVRIVVVPKLGDLRYVSRSRIFQDKPLQDIIQALLEPSGLQMEWNVEKLPLPRPYRVQRNETDFAFFCRILADSAIHFHIRSNEKETKVVFVDGARGYVPIEGDDELPYREVAGAVTVDHIGKIERLRGIRPGAAAMQEFDFKAPKDLKARFEVEGPHNFENAPRREVYAFPGDYIDFDAHRDGTSRATHLLQALRSDAVVYHGKSSCARLAVGHTFKLESHPDDDFNKELLIEEIRLHGQRAGILADTGGGNVAPGFSATFYSVPSKTVLRPMPPRHPPAYPESAWVTGPEQGSPFVDKFGRVKVFFHWDREGKRDENSSCWLRVMTPAAGDGRGIWFPPRVGDEVIVQFLNGDIDRPFVAGAIYDGSETQPYPLPDQSSKSIIKGRSIPGGKGFNELSFEDKAGQEQIFLHAQKDRRTVVLNNHNETVGANQSVTVGANQSITVGANRSVTVGANETTKIAGHRTETVDTGETVTIQQSRTVEVLSGDEKLEVTTGNRDVKVNLADTFRSQTKVDTIDQTFELKAGTSIALHSTSGDAELKIETGGTAALNTNTSVTLWTPSGNVVLAQNKITLNAVDEILLTCGKSSISVKSDGTIELSAGTKIVTSVANSSFAVDAKKAAVAGPSVEVNAVGQAKIQGAIVKIN